MNVKYQNGLITLTRSDITRFKNEAKQSALQELLERQQEVIDAVSEDSLHLVLLTGYKALIDMGYDYESVVEFGDRVADIITQLNGEEVSMDSLEQEIDEFGIMLIKEVQE